MQKEDNITTGRAALTNEVEYAYIDTQRTRMAEATLPLSGFFFFQLSHPLSFAQSCVTQSEKCKMGKLEKTMATLGRGC